MGNKTNENSYKKEHDDLQIYKTAIYNANKAKGEKIR